MTSTLVIPGQPISSSSTTPSLLAGANSFSRGNVVYSTAVGNSSRTGPSISVFRSQEQSRIPEANSIIVGTITRLTRSAATVSILTVDGFPCRADYIGLIRSTDILQTGTDGVKTFDWFRPKDVVRAKIISLGDSRSYFCSTAANSLGVLFGVSSAGNALEAKNWTTMIDPMNGQEENRKVAGPE